MNLTSAVLNVLLVTTIQGTKSQRCLSLYVGSNTLAQQILTQLTFPLTSQSVNGSSATGHCTGATRLSDRYQCDDPTSSVVHDGIIPTLTGNMWASQLLTINASSAVLVFDFTGTPNFQVRRVEMVVFNCPQWGISVQSVILTDPDQTVVGTVNPSFSSCDSLVRVCIGDLSILSYAQKKLTIVFAVEPTNWVHIAEVGFYGDGPTCPPEAVLNNTPTASTTTDTATADEGATVSICTSPISTPFFTTLTSVITAITTALLATLIFVLLQIVLCKYHPKITPGKPEPAALSARQEVAAYEQVVWNRAVSGPTHVLETRKGNRIDLMENLAYGKHISVAV